MSPPPRLVLLLTALVACKSPAPPPAEESPLRLSTLALDFGSRPLGALATLEVEVANPNRFDVALTLEVEPPFTLAARPRSAPGGSNVTLTVAFRPQRVGPQTGELQVNGQRVTLSAEGVDTPVCPSTACRASTFDAATGACVEVPAPDGTDCTGSAACLLQATCQQGECVGAANTCDDGNPCTVDVCTAGSGCGHVDGTAACPASSNPCEVPSCDPQTGCALQALPDGTSCGARDCSTAQVCIAGACVSRRVPPNQGCLEVVAGKPGGYGWADGPGPVARFSRVGAMAFDGSGNLYLLDGCKLRKVTPGGVVSTVAGEDWGCIGGIPGQLDSPSGLAWNGQFLVLREACQLSRVSPQGQVTAWVGGRREVTDAGFLECIGKDGIGLAAGIKSLTVGLPRASGLARGPFGHLWFMDDDGSSADGGLRPQWLRRVSPAGEVITSGRLRASDGSETQLRLESIAATADGRLYGGGWYGPTYSVVRIFPDGRVEPVLSGHWPIALGSGATGVLLAAHGVARLERDGGLEVLTGDFDAGELLDGVITHVAESPTGAVAIRDNHGFNVRWVVDGGLGPFVGPELDPRLVDGPAADARFESAHGLALHSDGALYVAEANHLRRLTPAGIVETLATAGSPLQPDGPFNVAHLGSLTAVISDGDDLLYVDSSGWSGAQARIRRASPLTRQLSTVAPSAGFGSRYALAVDRASRELFVLADSALLVVRDGGLAPGPAGTPAFAGISASARGGVWGITGLSGTPGNPGGCEVWRLDDAGVRRVGGSCDGVPRIYSSAIDLTADDADNVFLTTGDTAVFRLSPQGRFEPWVEMSDMPLDVAPEPSGSMLILVSGGVLRYRP